MRKLMLVAAALLAVGCGGAQGPEAAPGTNRYVITVEEMRAQQIWDTREAVRVLRPGWQRAARLYSDPGIHPVAGLHRLPQGHTAAVLFFPPLEAQTRFGMDHSAGVIAVVLPGGRLP